MARIRQTNTDLLNHLKDQIAFMVASGNSYDHGFESEGRRLAVNIRILVHDTSQSKSLLSQLGKKEIGFLDTASPFDPRNLLPSNCLTIIRMSARDGAAYLAPLDNLPPSSANRKILFNDWWSRSIIYKDVDGNMFTRSKLVLSVSNTDGGAHVDPELDEAYAKFSRFNALGWRFLRNDIPEEFHNTPVLPSIRQIAHELLSTLKDEFPDLWQQAMDSIRKGNE